jgi:D-alanine-D-alanine ligase-like ATP-grasp enzyme
MAACEHCLPFAPHHFENWLDDLLALWCYPFFDSITPSFLASRFNDKASTDGLVFLGIVRREKEFALRDVNPIAATFIKQGRKRGADFEALRGPFGYLTFFRMHAGGRSREFDRLPGASANTIVADDKWLVKQELMRRGYPVAPGRAFWWFRKRAAARFAESLGFPVVVKPRRGSLSQHMFIVKDRAELRAALRNVTPYSPAFLVEKFVPNATLYRVTIVDDGRGRNEGAGDKKVFVVKRLPARATGDGKSTLATLARKMKLDVRHLDHALIKRQGVALRTVIPKGKKILLHHKAVMALRSEIVPVPLATIHPTTLAMCRDIAERFRLPLVGIDILMEDHRRPLADQHAAILELNTLPNILMHTFTRNGREENAVADALVDLALAQS